jgi:hypothetical protein
MYIINVLQEEIVTMIQVILKYMFENMSKSIFENACSLQNFKILLKLIKNKFEMLQIYLAY